MKKAILTLLVLGSTQSFAEPVYPSMMVAKEKIDIAANSTSTAVLSVSNSQESANDDENVSASCSLSRYQGVPYARSISTGESFRVLYNGFQVAPLTLDDVKAYFYDLNHLQIPENITSVENAISYMAQMNGHSKDVVEQEIPRHITISLERSLVVNCVIQKHAQGTPSTSLSISKAAFSDLLLGLMDQGSLIPDPSF